MVGGSKDITYNVTANGLLHGSELTHYNHSINGDAYGNTLVASVDGDWLFGNAGDDLLRSDKSDVTFVGGAGNDVMHASGGRQHLPVQRRLRFRRDQWLPRQRQTGVHGRPGRGAGV